MTDIDALASRVKSEFDTFDLLSVSAGFSIPTPLENVTSAIHDEMFNLNAKGPFFAVQKLAPLINRGGAVVLTTSVANVKGLPGQATYGAAKAALRSLARTLAVELLPREIRVNAVTPGPRRCHSERLLAAAGEKIGLQGVGWTAFGTPIER